MHREMRVLAEACTSIREIIAKVKALRAGTGASNQLLRDAFLPGLKVSEGPMTPNISGMTNDPSFGAYVLFHDL